MLPVGILRKLVGSPLRRRLTREAERFLASTARCREIQRETLQRLVRLNADSQFSRQFGLSEVRSPADLRSRLPVTDYDFYAPYVERMKVGEFDALLGSGNRLMMFCLTSGTTSQSKFIPVTERFLKDYRWGWQTWGVLAFNDHPLALESQIFQINSDYCRFRTQAGTPCGNISGLVAVVQRPIVRTMYAVPTEVLKLTDPETKYYVALRFGLADPAVGVVMTANPGTLVRLATLADRFKESLIRDIHDGTISRPLDCPVEVRQRLLRKAKPRRRRAKLLERVVEQTGHLYPKDVWPSETLIAVWTGGSCRAYLGQLRKYFGSMPIRDHGLSASEGRMTIPVRDLDPAGILEIRTHFFEFVPEEEVESEHPTVLEAHELEEGRNYFILLTTSSGFYRYNIYDVVQCVGFHGTTPLLKFLHKGAHISNVTGEKLSESQAVEAVTRAFESLRQVPRQFTLAPVWNEPPGYVLMLEERDLPSEVDRKQLAALVDRQLQELNCEYREKRATGRLKPLQVTLLQAGAWHALFVQRTKRAGGSAEQYKHPCLLPDLDTASRFLRQFACPCGPPVEHRTDWLEHSSEQRRQS